MPVQNASGLILVNHSIAVLKGFNAVKRFDPQRTPIANAPCNAQGFTAIGVLKLDRSVGQGISGSNLGHDGFGV